MCIRDRVRSNAVDMVVIDSVAALTPKAEIEGEMGDQLPGLQARLMSQALRKLTGNIKRSNCIDVYKRQASPTAPLFLSQATGRPYGTGLVGLGALDHYQPNAKSLAFFTNNTWHATDALDLTLGLRYTNEKKSLSSAYSNPNGSLACTSALTNPTQVVGALVGRGLTVAQASAAAPQVIGRICLPWANVQHNGRSTQQEMEEKEWSGTIKAAYRWNENWMTYASAARGYKGGGFNLDRVPVSYTHLDVYKRQLQDTGVRDVKDLQVLVPGLTVTSTQSESLTTARIRGIGTVGDNAGLESSVGIVIDGVYRPRNGVGFGDLGELERVEVLKGPQGTVFGLSLIHI